MKTRTYLALTLAPIFLITAVTAWFVLGFVSSNIVQNWTEVITRNEAARMLQRGMEPIEREIDLARTLAHAEPIVAWAKDPDSQPLADAALSFMNEYRSKFQSSSYFVALLNNLSYYHNNADGEFTGQELRYRLDPNNSNDSWFFSLLEGTRDVNLNVDFDRGLKIVQLWINMPIRVEGQTLGMIGTGFDLDQFISANIRQYMEGYSSIFVDSAGAIQLDSDSSKIVMGSAGLETKNKPTIFQRLNSRDAERLEQVFYRAARNPGQNPVVKIQWEEREQFVGVAYIPSVDWYQLTFVDIARVLPISDFYLIILTFILSLLIALVVFLVIFKRSVIAPLEGLSRSVERFADSRQVAATPQGLTQEFTDIYRGFQRTGQLIIDHEHELEEKIASRTRELVHAERLASLGTIAAGVAHEINNPLGYIQSNIALLGEYSRTIKPAIATQLERLQQGSPGDPAAQAQIQELEFVLDDIDDLIAESTKGCQRIRHIVSALHDYAFQDEGIVESFSLNDVASMALDLMGPKIKAQGELVVDLSDQLPPLLVDPKALARVVTSLLENAVDAIGERSDGFVKLETGHDGERLFLKVTDNGVGIGAQDLNKLFTPFFTTKPVGQGTGLSLAVSQMVMRSMDGSIEVASELGKGSCFTLLFNLSESTHGLGDSF